MKSKEPELTDLQQAILHTKREHPGMSNAAIADRVGCSASYVTTTLQEYDTVDLNRVAGDPTTAEEISRDSDESGLTQSQKKWLFIALCIGVILAAEYGVI